MYESKRKKVSLASRKSFQQQEAAYESVLPSSRTEGRIIIFPDFKLVHVYYRDLSFQWV
jgi:hypothetical protein